MSVVTHRLWLAVAATVACIAVVACGGASRTTPESRSTASRAARLETATAVTATTTAATVTPPPVSKPKPKPKPDPGALPQTEQLPAASTQAFHAEMAALWSGVRANSVQRALPAFFPERAYMQLKQIGDPQGDWSGRLVADYGLDIAAAHALLGTDSASARLLQVMVPQSYAHWVPSGACYNGVGYYEVPNARVVYRQNGEIRSFGIASMISWRGVWYVVHLGAILRPSAAGVVDDPSTGTGESAPSSTC